MARTQAADYEQRREAILDRAAHLFATKGFLGTSVNDIADACATSKSLVYHYYDSKEDLLFGVMSSHIEQLEADVEEASAKGGSAEARLTALIHSFMQHYVGASDRQKVLLNELGSLPPRRRATIVNAQRRVINALQKMLVELKPSLASKPAEARVHTMLVFGMINWTHTWFDPDGPLSAEAIADMTINIVLASSKAASKRPAAD